MIGIVHGGGRTKTQERVTLGSEWTAPYNGTLVCAGRAQASSAYIFIKDKNIDAYIGMHTIEHNQDYGTITVPVVAGHVYEVRRGSWQAQSDLFIYES